METLARTRLSAIALLAALNVVARTAWAGDPETLRLIDQLTAVGQEGIGYDSTAWAEGFIAVDQAPVFRGGIIGSPKPVVAPPLRALVRKGLTALPDLLDHLSDRRETKVKVGGFMAMWHAQEYDPRTRPPETFLPGLKPVPPFDLPMQRLVDGYTLRGGDLCFVAVGQIVNRNLLATRYQPSLCLVINSSVETPALAASVRKDWGELTPAQHRESLVRDALAPFYDTDAGAVLRLLFYYPDEGERIALKLLQRPVIDDSKTWTFITTRLVAEHDASRWKPMIEEFGRAEGTGCTEVIPYLLRWIYWRTDFAETESFLAERATATRILATLYRDDDPNNPPFLNAAGARTQMELIEALAPIPSRPIDASIHRLWLSVRHHPALKGKDGYEWEGLNESCVRRLIGRGYPDVILPYLALRIDEIAGESREFDAELLDQAKRWLPLWILGWQEDEVEE